MQRIQKNQNYERIYKNIGFTEIILFTKIKNSNYVYSLTVDRQEDIHEVLPLVYSYKIHFSQMVYLDVRNCILNNKFEELVSILDKEYVSDNKNDDKNKLYSEKIIDLIQQGCKDANEDCNEKKANPISDKLNLSFQDTESRNLKEKDSSLDIKSLEHVEYTNFNEKHPSFAIFLKAKYPEFSGYTNKTDSEIINIQSLKNYMTVYERSNIIEDYFKDLLNNQVNSEVLKENFEWDMQSRALGSKPNSVPSLYYRFNYWISIADENMVNTEIKKAFDSIVLYKNKTYLKPIPRIKYTYHRIEITKEEMSLIKHELIANFITSFPLAYDIKNIIKLKHITDKKNFIINHINALAIYCLFQDQESKLISQKENNASTFFSFTNCMDVYDLCPEDMQTLDFAMPFFEENLSMPRSIEAHIEKEILTLESNEGPSIDENSYLQSPYHVYRVDYFNLMEAKIRTTTLLLEKFLKEYSKDSSEFKHIKKTLQKSLKSYLEIACKHFNEKETHDTFINLLKKHKILDNHFIKSILSATKIYNFEKNSKVIEAAENKYQLIKYLKKFNLIDSVAKESLFKNINNKILGAVQKTYAIFNTFSYDSKFKNVVEKIKQTLNQNDDMNGLISVMIMLQKEFERLASDDKIFIQKENYDELRKIIKENPSEYYINYLNLNKKLGEKHYPRILSLLMRAIYTSNDFKIAIESIFSSQSIYELIGENFYPEPNNQNEVSEKIICLIDKTKSEEICLGKMNKWNSFATMFWGKSNGNQEKKNPYHEIKEILDRDFPKECLNHYFSEDLDYDLSIHINEKYENEKHEKTSLLNSQY